MTCGRCPEGRRYMQGSVFCNRYGIIINEEHECTREGGKRHDRAADHSEDIGEKTGLQKDGSGAA